MPDDSPAVDFVALEAMTTTELARRFETLFGEPCRSCNKQWLLRRVALREQFVAGGDLTARAMESARQASEGITCDADIRVRPPSWVPGTNGRKVSKRLQLKRDPRIPPTGSVIRRVYRGEQIAVRVLEDGFEY